MVKSLEQQLKSVTELASHNLARKPVTVEKKAKKKPKKRMKELSDDDDSFLDQCIVAN